MESIVCTVNMDQVIDALPEKPDTIAKADKLTCDNANLCVYCKEKATGPHCCSFATRLFTAFAEIMLVTK